MITEVCKYLKNWFDWNQPKYFGKFKIENGVLFSFNDGDMGIATNQYYRIIGSVFNDGVYKHGEETLEDEEFYGAVWLMAVPKDFIELIGDMTEWQEKYGGASSVNMSPYQSESFNNYSYSKASSSTWGTSGGGSAGISCIAMFRDRLWEYKKT